MARICDLCGKGYLKGNIVCFSNKKSVKRSYPNLRKVRIFSGSARARLRICASCLHLVKKNSAVEEKSRVVAFLN